MSELGMKKRWINYAVNGIGQERSYSEERFGYKGDVLYSYSWPVARVFKLANGKCVFLTRGTPISKAAHAMGASFRFEVIVTAHIGALSEFAADVLPPKETHERSHWLYMLAADEIIGQAYNMSPQWLFGASHGKDTGGHHQKLTGEMNIIYDQHERYSDLFGLRWVPFSLRYRDELEQVIKDRKKAYFDKGAVAGRVRKKARREAKKALIGED